MKTIEELNAEHAKKVAELQREIAIASSLPIPPDRVMLTGSRMVPWVTYNVDTVARALEIFRTYANAGMVRNMEHAKGTYTTVGLASEREKRYEDKTDFLRDVAIALEVSQGKGFSSAGFFFSVEVSGRFLRIHASFGYRSAPIYRMLARKVTERNGFRNEITKQYFQPNDALNGYFDAYISYASGDMGPIKKTANMCYVIGADDGSECSEFADMLLRLDAMADEFDPKEQS